MTIGEDRKYNEKFAVETMTGFKKVIELNCREQTFLTNFLWSKYEQTKRPELEKAHLLISCLIHGKVEQKGV